jgi:hypothetical protein
MSQTVAIELELPEDLARFRLPAGVHARLQALLDRQDQGATLTTAEREEAEGLVDVAELLSRTRSRAEGDSRSVENKVQQHESRSCRHRVGGNPVGHVGVVGPTRATRLWVRSLD